jgi:hypothetical protein
MQMLAMIHHMLLSIWGNRELFGRHNMHDYVFRREMPLQYCKYWLQGPAAGKVVFERRVRKTLHVRGLDRESFA